MDFDGDKLLALLRHFRRLAGAGDVRMEVSGGLGDEVVYLHFRAPMGFATRDTIPVRWLIRQDPRAVAGQIAGRVTREMESWAAEVRRRNEAAERIMEA